MRNGPFWRAIRPVRQRKTAHTAKQAANAKLDAIEAWADEALPDADVSRQGNVLTLQLEGGNEIVLNLQTPWHEIWLASRLGGYHFRERDGVWHDTRTDATLEEKLEEAVKALTA